MNIQQNLDFIATLYDPTNVNFQTVLQPKDLNKKSPFGFGMK